MNGGVATDPSEPNLSSTARPSRTFKVLVVASLAAAFGLGALGAVVWQETRRKEIDRHEILAEVEKIAKAIRSHDLQLWMQIETHPPNTPADPGLEARHQKMLRELESLAHLEEFSMKDLTVHVDGDRATVNYTIEGRAYPSRPCGAVVPCVPAMTIPARGTLYFSRGARGWAPAAHEFHD